MANYKIWERFGVEMEFIMNNGKMLQVWGHLSLLVIP